MIARSISTVIRKTGKLLFPLFALVISPAALAAEHILWFNANHRFATTLSIDPLTGDLITAEKDQFDNLKRWDSRNLRYKGTIRLARDYYGKEFRLSADGRRVIFNSRPSSTSDDEFTSLDSSSGDELFSATNHIFVYQGEPTFMDESEDGSIDLFAKNTECGRFIFSRSPGTATRSIIAQTGYDPVNQIRIAPDRSSYAIAGGYSFQIWKAKQSSPWIQANILTTAVAFGQSSQRIVAGHQGSISVWSAQLGLKLFDRPIVGLVNSVFFDEPRNAIFALSYDFNNSMSYLGAWDATSGALLFTKRFPATFLISLQSTPSSPYLFASESVDRSIIAFNKENGEVALSKATSGLQLRRLAASDTRELGFWIGSSPFRLNATDLRSGHIAWTRKIQTLDGSAHFSHSDSADVVALADGKDLFVLRAGTGEPLSHITAPRPLGLSAISSDGRFLAASVIKYSYPGEIFVWDLQSGQLLRRTELPFTTVNCLEFADNDRQLICDQGNSRILRVNVQDGSIDSTNGYYPYEFVLSGDRKFLYTIKQTYFKSILTKVRISDFSTVKEYDRRLLFPNIESNGNILWVASNVEHKGQLFAIDARTGEDVHVASHPELYDIGSMTACDHGSRFLFARYDGSIGLMENPLANDSGQ